MSFAPESTYSKKETANRTSDTYVKWSPDHRTVLRMLNTNAKLSWRHWLSEANGGRGIFATCPNTTAQTQICPVCKSIRELDKDDPIYLERRAKKRYVVNVIDRTPYTVCNSCASQTPKGKNCQACKAPLKNTQDYAPLNRIKTLEAGPQLFVQTLNAIEQMQKEDFPNNEITDYDITFTVTGTGRDRKIAGIPQAPSELGENDLIDPETGEPQKVHDLDLLSEPNTVEEIEAFLQGGGIAEVNALRGLA